MVRTKISLLSLLLVLGGTSALMSMKEPEEKNNNDKEHQSKDLDDDTTFEQLGTLRVNSFQHNPLLKKLIKETPTDATSISLKELRRHIAGNNQSFLNLPRTVAEFFIKQESYLAQIQAKKDKLNNRNPQQERKSKLRDSAVFFGFSGFMGLITYLVTNNERAQSAPKLNIVAQAVGYSMSTMWGYFGAKELRRGYSQGNIQKKLTKKKEHFESADSHIQNIVPTQWKNLSSKFEGYKERDQL